MSKHGGKREGAGRPKKADELRLVEIGVKAIVKEYGSLEAYWEFIAKESKTSNFHMKTLNEYVYGKPVETKMIKADVEHNLPEWMHEG